VRNPQEGRFVDVGLPYGSRPRLILTHLNRAALLRGSPRIEVEASLTGFIRRVTPNNAPNTRDIGRFKDQLTRFAVSSVRMAVDLPDNRAYQVNTHIIESMELWLGKDERQRVLWPAVVELSPRYFDSLTRHVVPLDERAVAALSNSPMALDVYAWLGQRLCRVSSSRGQFVSWANLYDQFGQGFVRMRKFRETFLGVLKAVQSQYRQARFETDERGMTLHESRPPIPGVPLHLIKRG
jgi:replication initiator protein